jgi:hypothetical protein
MGYMSSTPFVPCACPKRLLLRRPGLTERDREPVKLVFPRVQAVNGSRERTSWRQVKTDHPGHHGSRWWPRWEDATVRWSATPRQWFSRKGHSVVPIELAGQGGSRRATKPSGRRCSSPRSLTPRYASSPIWQEPSPHSNSASEPAASPSRSAAGAFACTGSTCRRAQAVSHLPGSGRVPIPWLGWCRLMSRSREGLPAVARSRSGCSASSPVRPPCGRRGRP